MQKFWRSIPGGRVGHFVAGAAAASVLGGTAIAITSTDFTYSTLRTGYVTIHAMAMSPSNDRSTQYYAIEFAAGALANANLGSCYSTGVNLPDKAIVTRLTTWFKSGPNSAPVVYFERKNLVDGTNRELVKATLQDNSNQLKSVTQSISAANGAVDNNRYAFGYGFCPGNRDTFEGARITYTFRSAGD